MSFMWLTTGAYAEHLVNGIPGYPQLMDRGFLPDSCGYLPDPNRCICEAPECTRHKVMEGFAFLNWIQRALQCLLRV